MAIFKCKMCGGDLEIAENASIAICEYCSTRQTLPKLNDEKRFILYDRANHFRRNNEFDKAMGIYENILNEDNTDAEAYWSLILCRYGIEYVEDPASRRIIPTINRAQYTSIFDDDNYKSALKYADSFQRAIYEEEAKTINEIQKGILAISQREEPFDIFICYKETDKHGRRTPDSVLAQELYYQLIKEGFKVFFSRITLEDKLGSAYEPYIFAALNSAKVMVVLGTRAEYFNAVWVKNEWSRYLSLIKSGATKKLIPAYRDMDPYDLPEEFSHLQAQDMSKLGFMQDLIRGIKKILAPYDKNKVEVIKESIVSTENINATSFSPLLDRAFIFLEDGDWKSADEYSEKVLDKNPKCAEAYLAKLMINLKIKTKPELRECKNPFDENSNYQKAVRFADDDLRKELENVVEYIKTRNENERLSLIYDSGRSLLKKAKTEFEYKKAASVFQTIGKYKDAEILANMCLKKAEETRKDKILSDAKSSINSNTISSYEKAIELLKSITDWKNSAELLANCRVQLEKLKQIKEKRQERIAKISLIIAFVVFFVGSSFLLSFFVIIPSVQYNKAMNLMNNKNYQEAISIFESIQIEGYRDSLDKIEECKIEIVNEKYQAAVALMNAGKYEEAISAFEALDGYKDSKEKVDECNAAIMLNNAIALMNAGKYTEAISAFKELDGYKDSADKIIECNAAIIESKYNDAIALMNAGKYTEAISAFKALVGYKDSANKIAECNTAILDGKYNDAVSLMNKGKYTEAISAFEALDGYKDSANKIAECNTAILDGKYNDAIALMDAGNIVEAFEALIALDGYKDSADKANSIFDKYKPEKLKVAKAGDYVFFGAYEQDNNTSNGKEYVEWLVLEVKDGKALVISKYALDCTRYNTTSPKVTWETCTLRKWLNNDFINAAFSADEKAMIPTVTVSADKNPNYSTKPGNATQDQVFLLSITEVNKYFSSGGARQCEPTTYAVARGAYVKNGNCYWLLRTPGRNQTYIAYVYDSGVISNKGDDVYTGSFAVRPAMWIDLNS